MTRLLDDLIVERPDLEYRELLRRLIADPRRWLAFKTAVEAGLAEQVRHDAAHVPISADAADCNANFAAAVRRCGISTTTLTLPACSETGADL